MKVPTWLIVSWFPSWSSFHGPKKKAENNKWIHCVSCLFRALWGSSVISPLAVDSQAASFSESKTNSFSLCNWGESDAVILTPLHNIYHPLQLELEPQPSCQSFLWLLGSYSFKDYLCFFQDLWWMICRYSGKTFRVWGAESWLWSVLAAPVILSVASCDQRDQQPLLNASFY